jgi:carboxylesterase
MPDSPETTACLLIHGLNGGPHDFEDVAEHLTECGVPCESLLLPGHMVAAHEARHFTWDDWTAAAHAAFDQMAHSFDRVIIVGHSMGGALALRVAARDVRVAGVVTLCAPAELHAGLVPIVGLGRFVVPYLPIVREDISDPGVRRSYRRRKVSQWVSLAPMYTLLRALPELRGELPYVRCPALILAARNDHVVPVRDGRYIYDRIGSTSKELVILNHSWHVVTRDIERDIVTTRITRFLAGLTDSV